MSVTTFQRARSAEQRAVRRQVILETAAAMLTEMPVADLSLNELSRRVGLAKSNVLNYFESREAVLLELLGSELSAWVDALTVAAAAIPRAAKPGPRAEQLADAVVRTLAERPVFCDLISAQGSVLERNISAEAALAFKQVSLTVYRRMLALITQVLPEIGVDAATRFIKSASILAGAIWSHAHPTAAIVAAYESDPAIADLRLDFETDLREALQTLLYGVLPRARA